MRNKLIGRNWASVIYLDSCADDWQQQIQDLHTQAFISPYHDQDINPDGEIKKPHYHVLLMFAGNKSVDQISEIFKRLGAVGCECVGDLRGYSRYLCHLDNPEKHFYSPELVKSFAGADYRQIATLPNDDYRYISEMCDWIRENDCRFFCLLCDYARANEIGWYRALVGRCAVFMREYIKSYAYLLRLGIDFDSSLDV